MTAAAARARSPRASICFSIASAVVMYSSTRFVRRRPVLEPGIDRVSAFAPENVPAAGRAQYVPHLFDVFVRRRRFRRLGLRWFPAEQPAEESRAQVAVDGGGGGRWIRPRGFPRWPEGPRPYSTASLRRHAPKSRPGTATNRRPIIPSQNSRNLPRKLVSSSSSVNAEPWEYCGTPSHLPTSVLERRNSPWLLSKNSASVRVPSGFLKCSRVSRRWPLRRNRPGAPPTVFVGSPSEISNRRFDVFLVRYLPVFVERAHQPLPFLFMARLRLCPSV